jgi:putative protein kinase ArgK-like GTPase of G3E family
MSQSQLLIPRLIYILTTSLLETEEPEAEAGPSRQLERPKVPITLLTGYLGAGKSTLLEWVIMHALRLRLTGVGMYSPRIMGTRLQFA